MSAILRGNLEELLLRLGLAFAFIYPAVSAVFDPFSWIGYFPPFMMGIVPDALLLHAFGFSEVVIGVWLLSGWRLFLPSLIASAYLVAIVFVNFNQMDVIFRDISILAMALALMVRAIRKEAL